MRDEDGIAPNPLQPRDNILGIADAAAEQQELRLRRRQREREFVMHAAHGVADHLVFIHHQQLRAVPAEEARPLRLKRGDDDLGIEIEREVAGRDAHIPAARAPLREFIVRERAGGDSEDGLPFQARVEQLEDVSFARTSRRLHDHVLPLLQGAHRFLLPKIGDDQVDLESLQHRGTYARRARINRRSARGGSAWPRHQTNDQRPGRLRSCPRRRGWAWSFSAAP